MQNYVQQVDFVVVVLVYVNGNYCRYVDLVFGGYEVVDVFVEWSQIGMISCNWVVFVFQVV